MLEHLETMELIQKAQQGDEQAKETLLLSLTAISAL